MALELKKASNLIFQLDQNLPLPPEPPGSLMQSLPYYMEQVSKRDIFQLGAVSAEIEEQAVALLPPVTEDQTEKYSLVGIAMSDRPEAMIEDTDLQRTYFVKRGQPLDNDVKVIAIFKDRVVLSYRGREFELS